jgi:hypothetical protein
VQGDANPGDPHPTPLPEGEGTGAKSSCNKPFALNLAPMTLALPLRKGEGIERFLAQALGKNLPQKAPGLGKCHPLRRELMPALLFRRHSCEFLSDLKSYTYIFLMFGMVFANSH